MLAGNPLDALSWEPCILKHPAHYDNPWTDREGDWKKRKDKVASGSFKKKTGIALTVTNTETGETRKYKSYYECMAETGAQHRDLKECIYNGRIYKKVYKVTLTNP